MTNKYQQSYRGDFIYLGSPTHVRKIFVTKIQLHIAGSRIFRLFHVAACMYQLLLCIVPSVQIGAAARNLSSTWQVCQLLAINA